MQRWIIVSNRLPFAKDKATKKIIPSSGGLVVAISGIETKAEKIWVGISSSDITSSELKDFSGKKFKAYVNIEVSARDYDKYYNVISNDVLWPLFHYEGQYVRFDWESWKIYEKVNRLFAEKIAKIAKKEDLIWIHDFHLFLLPKYLRKLKLDNRTGFFLHIPFPSSEFFRQLPVAKEILEGMLQSDLVGFHEYSYLRHFRSSVQFILGADSSLFHLRHKGKEISLGVFPVSIDTSRFIRKTASKELRQRYKVFLKRKNYQSLVLGVDRLDYTKGVDLKLKAFQTFLREYPEQRGNVVLLQIAVPTRRDIEVYIDLKKEVERLVGEVNGEFGHSHYTPVQYLYKSINFEELLTLYRQANVLLVTSKRDGMNLVTLEYLASQDHFDPGVVVLSEFAGASSIIPNVLLTNPWDIKGTAQKISEALLLSKEERRKRYQPTLHHLKVYTASLWAENFIQALDVPINKERKKTKIIEIDNNKLQNLSEVKDKVRKKRLLLLLDYDGTLVPIESKPEYAIIDQNHLRKLKNLLKNKNVKMTVVSGRKSNFLKNQLKSLNIDMAAEHGATYYDVSKKRWKSLVSSDIKSWYSMAKQIMEAYTFHVPGSFIEKKEYSISWHYRNSPHEFAEYQANRMKQELEGGLANLPVTTIHGKKVIESKSLEASKGNFVQWYLENKNDLNGLCIICMGDDHTDEEMFMRLPAEAVSIKVGDGFTNAQYMIENQEKVYTVLSELVKIVNKT